MTRGEFNCVLAVATALTLSAVISVTAAGQALPADTASVGRLPRIQPDYSQLVIPPNIAPLNFTVLESGSEFRVQLQGTNGGEIHITLRQPSIVIPPKAWRELLNRNRGGRIEVDVCVKGSDGRWSRFSQIENAVAPEEIDSHLVYRLLGPVCNYFRNVRICQRNLESFDESTIVASDEIGGGCVNCHSFLNNRPDTFSLHVRPGAAKSQATSGMIVVRDGHATRLQTKSQAAPRPPGYLSWHPKGWVAFSMSRPDQIFRGAGSEVRDVFDYHSDLAVLNTATCAAFSSPGIADPDQLETFPNWSADGRTLYFSSAKRLWARNAFPTPDDIKQTRYDLMRVAYDVDTGAWGRPETVLAASETGKSILEPRASLDGRHLLFCMADYGGFPVHQTSCDLYLMDLQTGKYRRLECNSDQSDSWHCWSSNSRWIVFSSKRDNGLLARPYFCYVDAEGHEHKPFVLPQKDPAFYDTWLQTYNVPELVNGPVTIASGELTHAILSGAAATNALAAESARQPNAGHYMHE